jgi:predicted RNase H-like HicB family nuclease
MRTLTVVFHYEDGSWWAETDEVPGFVAGASTFQEARTLAREGLEFEFDDEVELDERFDAAARARRATTTIRGRGVDVVSSRSRGGASIAVRPPAPSRAAAGRGSMAGSAA